MMMLSHALLAFSMTAVGGTTGDPTVWPDQSFVGEEEQTLYADHIALDGEILLVSTGEGEVQVYHLEDSGLWELEETLAPGTPSSSFGSYVAIGGTRVAILDSDNGPSMYNRLESGSWSTNNIEDLTDAGKTFLSVGLVPIDSGDDMVVCFDDNGSLGFHTLDFVWDSGMGVFRWEVSDTVTASVSVPEAWGETLDLEDGRLAVGAPGSGEPFPEDGAAYVYDEISEGSWQWTGQILPSGSVQARRFGVAVSIDGDTLAIGAPGDSGGVDASTVSIYTRSNMGIWELDLTMAGIYNGFGRSVHISNGTLVAGSSGSGLVVDYPGYVEIHELDLGSGTSNFLATLRAPSQGYFGSAFGHAIAVDGEHIAASDRGGTDLGFPLFDDGNLAPPTLGVFTLNAEASRFWQETGTAGIGDAGSWTGDTGSRAVFSVPGAPDTVVVLDGSTSFDQLLVREIATFDLNSEISQFGNSVETDLPALRVNGRNILSPAWASLSGSGTMELQNDLHVGINGQKGLLVIGEDASLEVQGQMRLDTSSTILMTAPGETPIAQTGSLAGGLSLSIPEGTVPVEGDVYTLLSLGEVPEAGADAFNLVSLPGLPGGLAFELQYGASTARGVWSVSVQVVSLDELLDFGDPESTDVDSGAVDIEVVDLDFDKIDELCVLFEGPPGQVAVFNMNSSGDIVEQVMFAIGDGGVELTSGDLDGDSTIDLAVANSNGTVQVLINDDFDPSNGFEVTTFDVGDAPGAEPTCITAAQVDVSSTALELVVGFDNGDGTGSLITYSSSPLQGVGYGEADNHNTTAPVIGVDPNEDEEKKDIPFGGVKNDGEAVVGKRVSMAVGSLLTYETYPAANGLVDIGLRDLDSDGDTDIVMTSSTNNSLVLLEQGAGGTFGAPVSISAGSNPGRLVLADFNNDGDVDIAALTTDVSGTEVIRIFDNSGNFVFTTTDVGEGESPSLIDAGDVDGDGVADLVSIATTGSLLRGSTPTLDVRPLCPCPGDSDCDGDVDVEDLLNVLSDYGCTSDCQYDIDDNGQVDIEDLLTIIGNWNGCS